MADIDEREYPSRTWAFSEDEGGSTVVTINDYWHTVDVTTGPDCDGTTSERHYEFVLRTPEDPAELTYDNRGQRWQSDPVRVLCDNVQREYDDYVDQELGSRLRSMYVTYQPDQY